LCRACGHTFAGNETFCGVCGASRSTGKYPGGELQSKWATLWERQLSSGDTQHLTPVFRKSPPQPVASLPDEDVTANWAADLPTIEDEDNIQSLPAHFDHEDASSMAQEPDSFESGETSLVTDWNGTLKPQVPETFSPNPLSERLERLWTERRGDISLALAMIVVLVAAVWGFYPGRSHSPSASSIAATSSPGQKRPPRPKAPHLTFFERTLVNLGLADPPPVPTYTGNPEAKVWVDLSTALYHCRDSQLYGNTPKGKVTTQEDAQQDQFEPALRKPCD
jgi:hypothetical protein